MLITSLAQVHFAERLGSSNEDAEWGAGTLHNFYHSLEPRVFSKEAQMFISLTTARSYCQHISLFQEKNRHKYQMNAKFSLSFFHYFISPPSLTFFLPCPPNTFWSLGHTYFAITSQQGSSLCAPFTNPLCPSSSSLSKISRFIGTHVSPPDVTHLCPRG